MKTTKHMIVVYRTMMMGLIALLMTTALCYGQSQTEQLDALLNKYLEYEKFNGSVLVANQGKVLYKKGFGMANMEWDIPNAPNTKHRLGSVTKQFTGMLILQLAAEGKLDLQAPISTYLPDYPKKKGDKITTHHLLTHSSGIPNYTNFPNFFREVSMNPYAPEDFIELFQDKDLEFIPGERFNYSNSGYFLLGVIIEKLTEKTYEQALKDNIFTPLGMNDTGYDNHADILKNRATGYEKQGKRFVNSRYLDMSIPYAAGSMYSTVEDLYTWDQALYTTKILPRKYMDLFFEVHMSTRPGFGYAYGWQIGKMPIGNTTDSLALISHGGGINGFNTIIARSLADKFLVVLLNNTGGAPLEPITQAIMGIMNDKSYDLPKKSLAYEVFDLVQTKGIDEAMVYFKANKKAKDVELIESEMNSIGYQLMGSGKAKEAAEIFKLNIDAFPQSFNAYDSYGEALMNLGDKEGAIKNYKTSVEMNPANQNGIDMLGKLGVDTGDLVKEVIVPDALLESYVGKYALMPGFVITISKEGKQMKAEATGQPILDIFPKSDDSFLVPAVNAELIFNKGKDGKIESLTLLQNGQEMVGKRLEE